MAAVHDRQPKREGGCGLLLSMRPLCYGLDNIKREVLIPALSIPMGCA